MEAIYLIGSILTTFFTSLILSLTLPFRCFLRRFFFSTTPTPVSGIGSDSVTLYQGIVWHHRRRPVHHSFNYSVRYALIDLDLSPSPPSGHLSADQARRVASTSGPVFLLTIPASVGYEQNPLSLYYCYQTDQDSAQHLEKCIAEVTNTPWGERVTFVFNPSSDLVAKPLHVSPFMDMLGNWSIKSSAPGDYLHVTISVQHPELGDYFSATLKLKRVSPSFGSDHSSFFYLMPHKVAIWIYWHAFKLWWKGVQFLQHPRYTNPSYKADATIRDQQLQCCKRIGSSQNNQVSEIENKVDRNDRMNGNRKFTWTNAKWPWS
ncbi:uncharacterized protein LOC101204586 isoform X1 [Cucumis sativus]|uniref:DUF1365 domain-containing protein n=1 Tax=Cucumis sativus TaxID=3659 RepID=A0A0A0KKN8_CUCSA|nr:uncharacterized protein LOC101204586 isoform X1 [Cucumis sativus]KGN49404.1 hypothetical protein Csa_003719 [Cucumis sativus]